MWTVLICAAVGFLWLYLESDLWFSEGMAGAVVGAIMGVIIAFLIGGLIANKIPLPPERHTMVNIADNTEIHGTFFLFSGSIDEEPVYAWYEKTGPNTYKRRSVSSDNAEVHYLTNDEAPYYEINRFKYEEGFLKTWYFNLSSGKPYTGEDYDFYVPKGTITNDYKLDAQ